MIDLGGDGGDGGSFGSGCAGGCIGGAGGLGGGGDTAFLTGTTDSESDSDLELSDELFLADLIEPDDISESALSAKISLNCTILSAKSGLSNFYLLKVWMIGFYFQSSFLSTKTLPLRSETLPRLSSVLLLL